MPYKIPHILGIVNITEDSFSDGGLYLDPAKAIKKARQLYQSGADIIDLGAASSNINTTAVNPAEEIHRLKPVITYLKSQNISISVDTFKPEVQSYALEAGVDYINDIQGFPHPEIYPQLAQSNTKLIVMHSVQRLGPATVMETSPEEVYTGMLDFFTQRITALEKAGVSSKRIILDPGMGFFLGADPAVSIYVLKNLTKLKDYFKLPILVGLSRKSFLSRIIGIQTNETGPATLAAELYLTKVGTDYIRTHDAKALVNAIKITNCLI